MKRLLKRKLAIAALAPAIGLPFMAAPAFAQTTNQEGVQSPQSQNQQSQPSQLSQGQSSNQALQAGDMRASNIIGAKVKNQSDEDLGEVQDLIVDASSGQVQYVILAYGGVLGFNEKLFAYPMDRFKAGNERETLMLTASKEEMENAPGFDKSTWPNWGNSGYRGDIAKHFGQPAKEGGNLVRASQMLEKKVMSQKGQEAGEINDIVVSLSDGKVRHVALEPDEQLNMGDQIVLLPMDALRATNEQQIQKMEQQSGGQATSGGQAGQESPPSAQSNPQQNQDQRAAGGSSQQNQQTSAENRELALMLTMDTDKLKQQRAMPKDQWEDMESQAAAGQSKQQGASASGSSETQGSSASSGSVPERSGSSAEPGSQTSPSTSDSSSKASSSINSSSDRSSDSGVSK